MVIDAHMHLSGPGWVRGKYLKFVWTMYITEYNRVYHTKKTASDFKEMLMKMDPPVIDPEGDHLVEMMDKAGVYKGVIFPVDWAAITGEPKVPIREQNRAHAMAGRNMRAGSSLCVLLIPDGGMLWILPRRPSKIGG